MNRHKISTLILAVAASLGAYGQITQQHIDRARELVGKMTLDEKLSMLAGKTDFSITGIERLGIPEVLMADGPQGIRNHCKHSTLYPAGIATAATWNRDLARAYGEALGNDARARGVGILLGPGVNIYRSPLCGRNFEYMGEDPYLASEIALNYILGVQSRGVMATIKHFALNNQEWSRHHVSSDVDERTMHEIYFPTFRKAVQKGGVGAVMNSYNLINGTHATENRWLNIDVLRKQWGFNGLLMSDWTSVYNSYNPAASGLDLEMPKPVFFAPAKLKTELANGRITTRMVDEKVEHILSALISLGLTDRVQKDASLPLDNPQSSQVALNTARESIVMLKNQGNLLPLRGKTLVLGPNCDTIVSGGGSGAVYPFSIIPLTQGMKQMRKNTVTLTDPELYADVSPTVYTDSTFTTPGFLGKYYKNQTFKGKPDAVRVDPKVDFNWVYGKPMDGFPADHFSVSWTGCFVADRTGILKLKVSGDDGYRVYLNGKEVASDWKNHSISTRELALDVEKGKRYDIKIDYYDNMAAAVIQCSLGILRDELLEKTLRKVDNVVFCTGFNGDVEGEGFDRPFALPDWQEKLINRIAQINPNLVVVLNSGGAVDMQRWQDAARGILMAWYPGEQGGLALAEILTGKLSPSGKLPISYEAKAEDNPTFNSYHNNRFVGKAPRWSAPDQECKHVEYREGIFTGYRGYDRQQTKPLYPFGFGLSYTDFAFSDLEVKPLGNNEVEVAFTVRNTGKKEGAEVAQIYVGDNECSVARPVRELKEFVKVNLKPGESRRLTVRLTPEAFAFYDMDIHDFRVEPGQFTISVGNSSAHLPLSATVTL